MEGGWRLTNISLEGRGVALLLTLRLVSGLFFPPVALPNISSAWLLSNVLVTAHLDEPRASREKRWLRKYIPLSCLPSVIGKRAL